MTISPLLYRAPAVLYAALLFWASSRSRLPLPRLGWGFEDKLLHALAYALLSYFIYLALTRPRPFVVRPHLWTLILGTAYAASDEWHQVFVPGRVPDLGDFAADLAGLALVQFALWLAGWRARPRGL